jgi:hypothetical protein
LPGTKSGFVTKHDLIPFAEQMLLFLILLKSGCFTIVSVEGVDTAGPVGVKTKRWRWFDLTLFVLPNPLPLQPKGEIYLLQSIDGAADLHIRSSSRTSISWSTVLVAFPTMFEEPQKGFGSNAALFHKTRNPFRACQQFTPFPSRTVAENAAFGQFKALLEKIQTILYSSLKNY